jgi:hypothetical protein
MIASDPISAKRESSVSSKTWSAISIQSKTSQKQARSGGRGKPFDLHQPATIFPEA